LAHDADTGIAEADDSESGVARRGVEALDAYATSRFGVPGDRPGFR